MLKAKASPSHFAQPHNPRGIDRSYGADSQDNFGNEVFMGHMV